MGLHQPHFPVVVGAFFHQPHEMKSWTLLLLSTELLIHYFKSNTLRQ